MDNSLIIKSVESIQILKPNNVNVISEPLHHYKGKHGKIIEDISCDKNKLIISGCTEGNKYFEIKIVGGYDVEFVLT